MIRYKLAQVLKEENVRTRKRILKWVVVFLGALYIAINLACAYPIFGWHPYACLCDVCLERFEADRPER